MKNKGDKNETLSLFFNRHGVTTKMVMYGSKEQKLGSFRKTFEEADFHIKQVEPYSPWKLQDERNIKEMKKRACRKIFRAGAPKRIWENTLEFEAYVRSHTAMNINILQGELPETVMLGGASNISQFCEHGFWVMFRDKPTQ